MIENYNKPGVTTIFPKIGALITRGELPDEQVVFGATLEIFDDGNTYVVPQSIDGVNHALIVFENDLTINEKTGTIDFKSLNVDFTIRELREEDGYWISSLRMPLSVPIMENMMENARKKNFMAILPGSEVEVEQEKLIAYAFDDSLYVVGLVYSNDLGRWARTGADWVLMGADDDTFADSVAIEIDPERASEFVDLYDANYIPVSDAEEFEAVEEEPVPAATAPTTEK